MRSIDIQFIPHEEQRYNTVGDWYEKGATLHIRVSILPRLGSTVAVAIHELVEAWLCIHTGVSEKDVDAFDNSPEGKESDEPGDEPNAPYHLQHALASACERIVVAACGINWKEHEGAMEILMHQWDHQ